MQLSTVGNFRRQVIWPRIRTQRNHFNCFEKHILPFHFRCLWWWFVINSHIYVHKSPENTFWMKRNKSCRVLVWYELQQVRVFINGVMKIPDLLSCVLSKNGLLNRFIFYLILIESRTLDWISEINENTLFQTSNDLILENTCPTAVTSRCCWMKYR